MLYELVRKSRSYRGYDHSRKITKQELESFVECARLCPSSVNGQPLRYYLAWEPELVARIQPLTRWAKALPQAHLPHPGMEPTGFVVILQDLNLDSDRNRYHRDVGIVAQTMLLAAAEQDLGGCMIGNFDLPQLRKELNLPEHLVPMLVVAFGKPAENIVLTDLEEGGDHHYYRDEADVHYVPKRRLEDIILTAETLR